MKTRYELETIDEVLYVFKDMRSEGESFPYIGSTHKLHIINGKIKIIPKSTLEKSSPEYIVSDDVDSDALIIELFKSKRIDLSFSE
jgi:hypothetical protein